MRTHNTEGSSHSRSIPHGMPRSASSLGHMMMPRHFMCCVVESQLQLLAVAPLSLWALVIWHRVQLACRARGKCMNPY